MRSLRPLRINARARVLDKRRGLSQSAVGIDRQRRDAATSIVGYQDMFARFVDDQITGTPPRDSCWFNSDNFPFFGLILNALTPPLSLPSSLLTSLTA